MRAGLTFCQSDTLVLLQQSAHISDFDVFPNSLSLLGCKALRL